MIEKQPIAIGPTMQTTIGTLCIQAAQEGQITRFLPKELQEFVRPKGMVVSCVGRDRAVSAVSNNPDEDLGMLERAMNRAEARQLRRNNQRPTPPSTPVA